MQPPKGHHRKAAGWRQGLDIGNVGHLDLIHIGRLERALCEAFALVFAAFWVRPVLAHPVISRQRSTSAAFGAKRTLTEPRLQKENGFIDPDVKQPVRYTPLKSLTQ